MLVDWFIYYGSNEEAGEYFAYTVRVCGPLVLSHAPAEETTKKEDILAYYVLTPEVLRAIE
jgi:hypothetical protein